MAPGGGATRDVAENRVHQAEEEQLKRETDGRNLPEQEPPDSAPDPACGIDPGPQRKSMPVIAWPSKEEPPGMQRKGVHQAVVETVKRENDGLLLPEQHEVNHASSGAQNAGGLPKAASQTGGSRHPPQAPRRSPPSA